MNWESVLNAELARDPLPLIDPRDWQGLSVPPREWLVERWVPMRVVTLYYGDGGTGKTLTAIQLIAAMALKLEWFGRSVKPGGAILFTAEDDSDELHRRFAGIVTSSGHTLADLDGVTIIPMAGLDASWLRKTVWAVFQ
jgi:RecA-family ATPase